MRNFILSAALAALLIASAGHAQTLDQQERCAMEAKGAFQDIEAKDRADEKAVGVTEIASDYQSHYNTKIGKCLMLVEKTAALGG